MLPNCDLIPDPAGGVVCPQCGWRYPRPARRNCPAARSDTVDRTAAVRAEVRTILDATAHLLGNLDPAEVESRTAACQTCPELSAAGCGRHPGCSGRAHWARYIIHDRCERFAALRPAIKTRNLIYHVWPSLASDSWRANLRQIVRRWDVFTGVRVFAVATGPETHDAEAVVAELPARGLYTILDLENDRRLREVATLRPLLDEIRSTDPAHAATTATFYAHTKGGPSTLESNDGMNERVRLQGATRWRNAMYHHLLDRADEAMIALRRAAAVGTTKIVYPPGNPFRFPSGLRHGEWMFAGTFFWFRHDVVFSRPDWDCIPDDRYGAEAWLGGLLPPAEAASMFQPWPENQFPAGSPYDPKYYPAAFDEEVLA